MKTLPATMGHQTFLSARRIVAATFLLFVVPAHAQPSPTLNPQPPTLNHSAQGQPSALNPQPSTLNYLAQGQSPALDPQPSTLNHSWQPLGLSGGGAMFTPAISPADPNLMLLNCDM